MSVVVADHAGAGLDRVAALAQWVSTVNPDTEVRGVVRLVTCNRVEMYLDTAGPDPARSAERVAHDLAARAGTGMAGIKVLTGRAAVTHLFSVVAGLESMVVGEREIVGQIRRSLNVARADGTTTGLLEAAFQTALRVARDVAACVPLGSLGRSVVSVALELVGSIGPTTAAFVIGTGSYAGACVAALRTRGVQDITVHSSSGRGEQFALTHQVKAETDFHTDLQKADLVLATSGIGEVLRPDQVKEAKQGRPISVVDLALRRDVAPEVGDLPGVRLISLRDVAVYAPHPEIDAARVRVDEAVEDFLRERRMRAWAPLVVEARSQVLGGCCEGSPDPESERRLVRRRLHEPTIRAKRAAADGDRPAYMAALAELSAIGCLARV